MLNWSPGMTLEDVEILAIKKAIQFYRSEEKAATSLKITLKVLKSKLEKSHLDELKAKELREEEEAKQRDFVLRSRGLPTGSQISGTNRTA